MQFCMFKQKQTAQNWTHTMNDVFNCTEVSYLHLNVSKTSKKANTDNDPKIKAIRSV